MSNDLNLDVAKVDEVSNVLRKTADSYYEGASELESAWQDKAAGKPWVMVARELEKTAERIDNLLRKAHYIR